MQRIIAESVPWCYMIYENAHYMLQRGSKRSKKISNQFTCWHHNLVVMYLLCYSRSNLSISPTLACCEKKAMIKHSLFGKHSTKNASFKISLQFALYFSCCFCVDVVGAEWKWYCTHRLAPYTKSQFRHKKIGYFKASM